ncbi:hypothetical protein [Rhizobium laguerreae]|uniref:hypothetical protein n=1 Tax=Rhizobium laguerreae TaxID=1076926 RepID=UPI0014416FA5|nr:hypothetical protein [Rhizobium laguerreae]NKM68574.1 hypothetical protein [Rhizobium laguerreae]
MSESTPEFTGSQSKPCKVCGLLVPQHASKCTHCDSYQDWRRYITLSTTMVALLTALISVIVTGVPQLYQLVHVPRSSPAVSLLQNYDSPGSSIFLVSNSGDRPAAIEGVMFNAPNPVGSWGGSLPDELSNRLIDPGKGKLIRVTFPGLEDNSYSKRELAGKRCNLTVFLTQFNGQRTEYPFPDDNCGSFNLIQWKQ